MRLRPPYGSFLSMGAPYGERGEMIAKRARLDFPPAAKQQSMPLLIREMDEAGVTMGLVAGKAMAPGVPNEEIARLCTDYPGRFVAAANVSPDAEPDSAAAELRRCVEQLGMTGLVLETGMSRRGVLVDDRSLYPLYEEAARLEVPVLFTLSMFVGADIGYCQRCLFGLDRLANDFPSVDFVVSHGGWSYAEAAIALALKRSNVYLSPDFYSLGFPFSDQYFVAANGFLQDQFLFGSAYPFAGLAEAVRHHEAMLKSERVRAKVFCENAARLLKLDSASRRASWEGQ